MLTVKNPIITGFNPDPCIIRVEDSFYLATSTFEWFPGVMIYHSKDLKNWETFAKPLSRVSQLNLEGNDNSGGVCAPCLSYSENTFYLTYSNLRSFEGWVVDVSNYIVFTDCVTNEWSEPVPVPLATIDLSLYHHPDGTKWIVYPRGPSKGIFIRQFDISMGKFIGEEYHIMDSTYLGMTEAPHIYKHGEYFYLVTAEGGTAFNHSVTVARSKSLISKFELDPKFPTLTASDDASLYIQKAGHASLVETMSGQHYMVYLCGRPITEKRYCPLGRETSLVKIIFDEFGWIRLENGTNKPDDIVLIDDLDEYLVRPDIQKDDFDNDKLNIVYQFSRVPLKDDECSLSARKGYLRLKGCSHLGSRFKQGMLARRQKDFKCEFNTCFEFEPITHHQTAGIALYYNTRNYTNCYISKSESGKKIIVVENCINRNFSVIAYEEIEAKRYWIRGTRNYEKLSFEYSTDGENFKCLASNIDSMHISDDFMIEEFSNYTGSMIAIFCEDYEKTGITVDFDFFEYKSLP